MSVNSGGNLAKVEVDGRLVRIPERTPLNRVREILGSFIPGSVEAGWPVAGGSVAGGSTTGRSTGDVVGFRQ